MKNRYYEDIIKENVLSKSMQKRLFNYLGVKYTSYNIVLKIVILAILGLIALFILAKNAILFIIYLCLIIIFIISYLVVLRERLNMYYKKLYQALASKYSYYRGMKRIYTYTLDSTACNVKSEVYLFSDDYYFYICSDPLIKTNIKLNNKYKNQYNPYPVFKIYDENYIDSEPYQFKLSDIESYKLCGKCNKEIRHNPIDEFCHIFSNEEKNNYVLITLKDFKNIKIGTNVYEYLRKLLPYREEKDEK